MVSRGLQPYFRIGTHNGQGLGIHDGGKLTAIISDGGGSQFGMMGSEWLTRVPILLQIVTIYFTKKLDLYRYLSLYLTV